MIGTTISHYKILEKLGKVPNFPTSAPQRVNGSLSLLADLTLMRQAGIRLSEAKAGADYSLNLT